MSCTKEENQSCAYNGVLSTQSSGEGEIRKKIIDAPKMGHMVDCKHHDFTDKDIQKLANTFKHFRKNSYLISGAN